MGDAYHTVLTADARERPFLTHRRVVMALSGMDMSVHRTRIDWATCSAWRSGVVASLWISAVKSVEAAQLTATTRSDSWFFHVLREAEVGPVCPPPPPTHPPLRTEPTAANADGPSRSRGGVKHESGTSASRQGQARRSRVTRHALQAPPACTPCPLPRARHIDRHGGISLPCVPPRGTGAVNSPAGLETGQPRFA